MKTFIFTVLLVVSGNVVAAGYTSWAIPKSIELVNDGLLVEGDFGDPNSCSKDQYVFIRQDSASFDAKLSIILSALHGQKKMRFYVSSCVNVSFHWSGEVINQNSDKHPVYIK